MRPVRSFTHGAAGTTIDTANCVGELHRVLRPEYLRPQSAQHATRSDPARAVAESGELSRPSMVMRCPGRPSAGTVRRSSTRSDCPELIRVVLVVGCDAPSFELITPSIWLITT